MYPRPRHHYQLYQLLGSIMFLGLIILFYCWYWHKQHSLANVLSKAFIVEITKPGTLENKDAVCVGPTFVAELESTKVIYFGKSNNVIVDTSSHSLDLLKKSSRFHQDPPRERPNYIFSIHTLIGNHIVVHCNYIISSGELGRDHEWYYVPDKFRDWMKTLSVPKQVRYKVMRLPYATIEKPIN